MVYAGIVFAALLIAMSRSKTSIAFTVAVAVASVATVVLVAMALLTYCLERQRGMKQLLIDHASTADEMALSLALPVWNLDRAQIDRIIDANMRDRDNFAIVVRLMDVRETLHARGRDTNWNSTPITQEPAMSGDLLKETRGIYANGERLGAVTVFASAQFLEADLKKTLETTIVEIAVFDVLLTIGLYLMLWWIILRPIRMLERDATHAGEGDTGSMKLHKVRFQGELENLRGSLETMFRLLKTRYDELQESEERYRNLNAAAFEGIAISENGRLLDVNDQALKMFGYEGTELIGREVVDVVAPESREIVSAAIRENRETTYEHRLLRKDGSTFFAEARARMARVGGRSVRMTALRDISERKLSEELNRTQSQVLEMITRGEPLRETLNALLRMIEAQSPEMLCSILLVDSDGVRIWHGAAPSLPAEYMKGIDGQPVGPSAGSCGTAVFRRERVFVADIANDPLWVDYRDLALRHGLRACWSTPIFDAQRRVLGTFAIYYRSVGLPSERHLRLINTATHTAAVCIAKSKTDDALRESEERFRALVEYSPDSIAVAVDERLVYLNPAGASLIGAKDMNEVLGRYTYDFVPADLHEQMRERRKKVLEENLSSPLLELPLIRLDGSTVSVESKAVPFAYGGRRAILNLMRDITERQRAELERFDAVAREKKAREEFTHLLIASQEAERARISREIHDGIGQNLSIIMNRAYLAAQESSLTPTVANHLQAIERIATDAIGETRSLAHNLRPLHIEQIGLTNSLRELIREVSQSSQIHFERRVENVDEVFKADAAANIYRIVQEALNNLIRHSRARQASITVERDVRSVRLRISDDGDGFDVNETASRRGLGLTSMTERVRMLGGTFNLKSEPGKGTELTVELPLEVEPETAGEET